MVTLTAFAVVGLSSCANKSKQPKPSAALIQPQPVIESSLDKDDLYDFLVADISTQRQNYNVAAENYLELARRNSDVSLAEDAVRSAMQAGDSKRALAALELWLEINPNDERALALVTRLYLSEQRIDDAYTRLEQIRASRANEEGKGFLYVARLLVATRQRDAATELMDRLAAAHNGDIDAAYAKSYLALQFGQYERANRELEPVLQARGDEQAVILQKTLILRRMQKNNEAAEFLASAVERQLNNFDLRSTYAGLLVDAGRYDEALEQYQRLAEMAPDNDEVIFASGLLSLQLQQIDAAEAQFKSLYQRGSSNPNVPYNLARIAEVREDIDGALRLYSQVTGGQNYTEAQIRIAILTAMQGDILTARAQLGVLRTNIPAMAVQTSLVEGGLLQDANLYDEAIAVYDEALKANPSNTQILYARSLVYAQTERFELFEKDVRAILVLDAHHADALNALGYYLADSTTRYDEAEKYIKRALELKGDSHFVLDSYGWLQFRLGNFDEALAYIRRALAIQSDAEISAHLGEILWVTGQRAEARRVLRDAAKEGSENKVLKEVMQRLGL
ncbi:MAG: tetratricopeptide repeat protein [Gammaproteobacteria bacterium]|nr:tetratricopeptide repeat protein [Gammaproteobacteria bacterium]